MANINDTDSKEAVENVEKTVADAANGHLSPEEQQFLDSFTPKQEAAIYRKVSLEHCTILPLLVCF